MRPSTTASANGADQRTTLLSQMIADQLLDVGTRGMAYLRAGTRDGERLVVLYGADGMPLVMVPDVETAVEIAEFIAVH